MLVRTKRFDDGGNIQTITRHDAARRIVSRDRFDPAGQLVCTDGIDPSTGHATLRRWFDESGNCWLTCWLTPSGHPRGTVQHHPTPAAYDRFGQRVAEWVDHVTSDWASPVVMADLRRHDSVLLNLMHAGAKTKAKRATPAELLILDFMPGPAPHVPNDVTVRRLFGGKLRRISADTSRMTQVLALAMRQYSEPTVSGDRASTPTARRFCRSPRTSTEPALSTTGPLDRSCGGMNPVTSNDWCASSTWIHQAGWM